MGEKIKRKKRIKTNEKNKKEGITGLKKEKSLFESEKRIARCVTCETVQFACASRQSYIYSAIQTSFFLQFTNKDSRYKWSMNCPCNYAPLQDGILLMETKLWKERNSFTTVEWMLTHFGKNKEVKFQYTQFVMNMHCVCDAEIKLKKYLREFPVCKGSSITTSQLPFGIIRSHSSTAMFES